MLMMPPALQTKSGAQRMPRAASSSLERVVGELVVGGAGDRAAAQRGHGLVVEHAAERARREDVDVGGHRRLAGRSSARRAGRRARACAGRCRRARAPRRPRRAARRAGRRRCPSADHGDAAALEDVLPKSALAGHADRDLAAERGPRARVARAAALGREPGDVRRRLGDRLHVGLGGADVLGGEVGAVERLRRCRRSRAARSGAARPPGRPRPSRSMITPLPPPSGRPATADLKVIARERRSTSRIAARESS